MLLLLTLITDIKPYSTFHIMCRHRSRALGLSITSLLFKVKMMESEKERRPKGKDPFMVRQDLERLSQTKELGFLVDYEPRDGALAIVILERLSGSSSVYVPLNVC
jgi:hypothetical protein